MATHYTPFKVRGTSPFPIDMLRYDCAFPRSELDAATIDGLMSGGGGRHTVELMHVQPSKGWFPTFKRWESFGWSVVNDWEDGSQ